MHKKLSSGLHSLTSPAGIIAILALIISMGGTAYAAAYITSADIVNGTITKKDLSGATKKWVTQSGARAVFAVWGDGSGCYVISSLSRGVTGTCTRTGTGQYVVDLKASVKTTHTAPVCSQQGNGGYNTTYTYACQPELYGDHQVRVSISRTTETTTTSPREPRDAPEALPMVVVVP